MDNSFSSYAETKGHPLRTGAARATLEAGRLLRARSTREPSGEGPSRLHNSSDHHVPAGREEGCAAYQEDRKCPHLRAAGDAQGGLSPPDRRSSRTLRRIAGAGDVAPGGLRQALARRYSRGRKDTRAPGEKAMIEHLYSSTLFAVVAAGAFFCLRRSSAGYRYMILLLAVLRFAVPTGMLAAAGRALAITSRAPLALGDGARVLLRFNSTDAVIAPLSPTGFPVLMTIW